MNHLNRIERAWLAFYFVVIGLCGGVAAVSIGTLVSRFFGR